MIVVDVNILIYAVNADAHYHDAARRWLDRQLSAGVSIGLPWVVLTAFIRLTTNPKVFPQPLDAEFACDIVGRWLAPETVTTPGPGPKHHEILSRLLLQSGTAGNLTTDAHLAAIAIEHAAVLCSADNDFLRFQGVQHHNPLIEGGVREPSLAYGS